MKKFLAFIFLSTLLTFAVVALAQATVLENAPEPIPEQPIHLEALPASLV